jgi:Viral BACON domain
LKNNIEKLLPLIVNPTPINFGTLSPDRSISMPVLLSNPNDKPIIWTADGYGTPWLMLEKATSIGTLQPRGQKEIMVTVNTSSMLPGSYTAILTITSDVNDDFANVQVPVLLTVSAASN